MLAATSPSQMLEKRLRSEKVVSNRLLPQSDIIKAIGTDDELYQELRKN